MDPETQTNLMVLVFSALAATSVPLFIFRSIKHTRAWKKLKQDLNGRPAASRPTDLPPGMPGPVGQVRYSGRRGVPSTLSMWQPFDGLLVDPGLMDPDTVQMLEDLRASDPTLLLGVPPRLVSPGLVEALRAFGRVQIGANGLMVHRTFLALNQKRSEGMLADLEAATTAAVQAIRAGALDAASRGLSPQERADLAAMNSGAMVVPVEPEFSG